MTEIERLEKEYDEKRYKFEAAMDAADAAYVAASVVYDAANDVAEAVRDAATRATEEEFTIAAHEVRAAALALYKARKEQAADEIDALEADKGATHD